MCVVSSAILQCRCSHTKQMLQAIMLRSLQAAARLSAHWRQASNKQEDEESTCMQGPPPGFTPEAQHAAQYLPGAQAQHPAGLRTPPQQSSPWLPEDMCTFLDSYEAGAFAAVRLSSSTDPQWPKRNQVRLSEACSRLTCPCWFGNVLMSSLHTAICCPNAEHIDLMSLITGRAFPCRCTI